MSLLDIARPSGTHRAVDEVDRLRHLLAKERAATAELRRRLAEATTARDSANAKASHAEDQLLIAAGVTQERDALYAEVLALRAFKANVTAVTAPAGHRDVAPDDQPTQPIRVLPLWEAIPGSTDPAHIPGPRAV